MAQYDNSGQVSSISAGSALESSSFTIGANPNRVLYVWAGSGDPSPAAPTSIKWGGSGGVDATQQGSAVTIGGLQWTLWRLIAPNTGSSTVYGTWPSSQAARWMIFQSVYDVDQTTPNGTVATNTGSNDTPTVNVSTVSGQLVLDGMMWFSNSGPFSLTATVGADQASRQEIEGGTILGVIGCGTSTEVASGGTTTMSWGLSGTPSDGWGTFAFALNDYVALAEDIVAAGELGAVITGSASVSGGLVGPGDFGAAFSGRVAAKASMTAGFGAGTADGSVADAVASVMIPVELALAAAALRRASGAITAGQELGEAWASQAVAAALMAASGEFGAAFDATSSGSEDAAFTAGTEASASFLAAAQAFGQLIPGATVGDLFVGIAQARGSVDASSSLSYVAAASVAMQVSIETGLELGEAWASHASAMADMASAGEFGISFTAETQAAQAGSFAAGTVAAAQFLSSISALGALVGVASFGMALQAVAMAEADLEVVAYLGAAFGTGDMPPTPPIPPGRTVTVMARSRLIRIPSRSRTIRVY